MSLPAPLEFTFWFDVAVVANLGRSSPLLGCFHSTGTNSSRLPGSGSLFSPWMAADPEPASWHPLLAILPELNSHHPKTTLSQYRRREEDCRTQRRVGKRLRPGFGDPVSAHESAIMNMKKNTFSSGGTVSNHNTNNASAKTRCLVTGQRLTVVCISKSQRPVREGSSSHQPLGLRACGVLSLSRSPPDPCFSPTFLQTIFILSAQRPHFQQRGTISSWLLNHYLIRERIPEERFLLYTVWRVCLLWNRNWELQNQNRLWSSQCVKVSSWKLKEKKKQGGSRFRGRV